MQAYRYSQVPPPQFQDDVSKLQKTAVPFGVIREFSSVDGRVFSTDSLENGAIVPRDSLPDVPAQSICTVSTGNFVPQMFQSNRVLVITPGQERGSAFSADRDPTMRSVRSFCPDDQTPDVRTRQTRFAASSRFTRSLIDLDIMQAQWAGMDWLHHKCGRPTFAVISEGWLD